MIALGFVSAYCRDDNALAGCISGRLCSLDGHKELRLGRLWNTQAIRGTMALQSQARAVLMGGK
jgi:hypothetical protein